jgi:hypothetical protein
MRKTLGRGEMSVLGQSIIQTSWWRLSTPDPHSSCLSPFSCLIFEDVADAKLVLEYMVYVQYSGEPQQAESFMKGQRAFKTVIIEA